MKKNILRTHTTAVSSRMLYKLAEQKPFKPMKYFSIDRVFRNETVDSTHLAECKCPRLMRLLILKFIKSRDLLLTTILH
jgi:phenylalanyl-tRNA synthetase alpha subunit